MIAGRAEGVQIPSGAVGWWRAEGNNTDALGNGRTAIPGGASFAPGFVGQAFSFAGAATGVSVGNPTAFQLQNLTVEAWIKRADASQVSQGSPAAGLFGGGAGSYALSMLPNGQLILGKVALSNVYSTATVKDTNWHHVAVTRDGVNVSFYIDGATAGTATYAPAFEFNTPFAIGSLGTAFGAYYYNFWGLIDEVGLYNRALSSAEIGAIYGAGAAGKKDEITTVRVDAPSAARAGVDFITRFSIKNENSDPATNVLFDVSLPAGYTLVSHTPSSGSDLVSASSVKNTVATIPSGETVTLTLTGHADTPSALLFHGQVSRNGAEPKPHDGSVEATVFVLRPDTSPPAGIVGWWRGEGNYLDSADNGGAAAAAGVGFAPGHVGQAFELTNALPGVEVGNPPVFRCQNFTIEAWIRRYSTNSASHPFSVGTIFGGGVYSYALVLEGAGQLSLSKVAVSKISSTARVTDTGWHHVAVTKNGADVHFFIDGADAGSGSYDEIFTFETPFAVGSLGAPFGSGDGANSTFWGEIDELTLYNRALIGLEIDDIYEAGAAGKSPENLLGGYQITAPQTVAGGTDFKVVCSLKNLGSKPATNLVLTVSLPSDYHLVSGTASFGSVTIGADTVQNTVASLPPGATLALTLTGNGNAPASLTFQGQVTSDGGAACELPPATVSTLVSIGSAVPDGIVGWWRAEGDNQDVYRNGTTNAPSTFISGAAFVPGFVGQAFSITGKLIAVRVGNPAAFQQQDVTIEAWVRRSSAVAASQIDNGTAGTIFAGGSGCYGLVLEAAGELSFSKVGVSKVSSTAKIKDTLWHHVAVTKQATNVNFYVDGKAAGSAVYDATFTFTVPFAIGSLGTTVGGSNYTFWGLIDELGLYRRGLSGSEIGAIYEAQSAGKRAENIVLSAEAPATAQPGADFTATFAVFNDGLDVARNVVLNVNLPAGLTLVSQTASQGENVIDGATLHNSLGTLLPGDTVTVSLTGHASVLEPQVFDGQITRTGTDLTSLDNQARASVEILGPCAPIASDGLLVWLHGDGNAQDALSHPVSYSGPGYVRGRVNESFGFDGRTSEVSIPDSPDLDVASFTVEAWVFPTGVDGSVDTIVSKEINPQGPSDIQLFLGIKGPLSSSPSKIPQGNLVFLVGGVGAGEPGFGSYFDAQAGIPLNQWSHVALTLGSGKIKAYVNGAMTFQRAVTGVPTISRGPLRLGSRDSTYLSQVPQDRFAGQIDEFSYYSRVLADAEIASIYRAGGAGKCIPAIAPNIVSPPTNQTVMIGTNATFRVVAQGTGPLTYQWKFKGDDILDATNATLVVPVRHLADAGTYGVTVCNAAGCAPFAAASLKVVPLPATVSVVNTAGQSTQDLEVPIRLVGSGLEHALSFSLQFDPTILTYLSAAPGADVTDGQIQADTTRIAQGVLGLRLTLPVGGTLAEGTNDVLHLRFGVAAVSISLTVPLAFGNSPTAQALSDSSGEALPAAWANGSVSLAAPGLEGDVAPLPSGDQVLNGADTLQVGRYVVGLDDVPPGSVFQRADCAPLAASGDGVLSVSDWVQVARFATGRDHAGLAAGPDAPLAFTPAPASANRVIHLGSAALAVGVTREIPVLFTASGEENAVGFSVEYNPAELTFVDAVRGADSQQGSVLANARSAPEGRVGVVVSLNAGSRFPAGPVELVRLRFMAAVVPGQPASLAFGDAPVVREVASFFAEPLPVSWQGASFSVGLPACTAAPEGLSVWLRGEGNADDAQGHPSAGTGVDYAPGKVGQAIRFNGAAAVTVPDSPDLNQTNFTVEAWVYPTSLHDVIDLIASKTLTVATQIEGKNPHIEYATAAQFSLGIRGPISDGAGAIQQAKLAFAFGSSSTGEDVYAPWMDGNAAVPLNQWTHIALTLKADTATVYVNGAVTRRLTGLTAGPALNTEPLRLGVLTYAGNAPIFPDQNHFSGLIDEFSFYSRPLSDDDITAIYLAGAQGKCGAGEPTVNVRLVTTQDGPAIELSWPASLAGASLEMSETLGGAWSPVNRTPVVSNGQNTVTLPLDASAVFFHLRRP